MKLHFALIFIVLTVGIAVGQVTKAMEQQFIKMHNNYRQKVKSCQVRGQPGAELMPDLRWNAQLAAKAQVLANQCRVGHDTASQRKIPAFRFVGQNWAGDKTIERGMAAWFDEYANYNYDSQKCRGVCGHYTQMVWANTKEVGCGVKNCGTSGSFRYGLSIVCNYGPAFGLGYLDYYALYKKKIITGDICGLHAARNS